MVQLRPRGGLGQSEGFIVSCQSSDLPSAQECGRTCPPGHVTAGEKLNAAEGLVELTAAPRQSHDQLSPPVEQSRNPQNQQRSPMGHNHSAASPQVLLMGLDSAGKSTLLARLLTGQVMDTSPTIGFNVGTLDLDKKTSLTVWDVGGQKRMRHNWRFYLDGCRALVFVVDSSDPARLPEAKKVLRKVLSEETLQGVPLMVLANKKDKPNAMLIREISTQLDLPSYSGLRWEIQACSAVSGLGLQQAFLSVAKLIKKT